jgi:cytidine deaminase
VNATDYELIAAACAARDQSYAPYSGFRVGAALRCLDGHIVTGTNVENASFGLSICAERAAVARAVAEGRRTFAAIAICADGAAPTPPCGACRQVLREFAPELAVFLAGDQGAAGQVVCTTMAALLPAAFSDFPGSRRGGGPQTTG